MTEPIRKAIIPAAGLGTRLLPATKSQPKETLPVGRKPILQYVVEELQGAGLRQFLIVTGRRKRVIEDHFDVDPQLNAALEQAGSETRMGDLEYLRGETRFFYTRQTIPRGLGHAVSLGSGFVDGDPFVVALGDSILAADNPAAPLNAMVDAFQAHDAAAVVAVEKVERENVYRYGIVDLDGEDPPPGELAAIRDIVEKPTIGDAPSTIAAVGRYVFSPVLFDALARTLPDAGGEVQLADAIRLLIQMDRPVYAWRLRSDQRRYDVGNFESYFRAFIDFALRDERYGYLVRKHIKTIAYEL
jgi:UTP--glucose-1-phosphate uridylyltransferase